MSLDQFTFNADTTKYDPANAYWLGKAARLAYRDGAEAQSTTAGWGLDRSAFSIATTRSAMSPGTRRWSS
jgi:hypothetical protein